MSEIKFGALHEEVKKSIRLQKQKDIYELRKNELKKNLKKRKQFKVKTKKI